MKSGYAALLVIAVVVLGLTIDFGLLRPRGAHRDSGPFWARHSLWWSVFCAALLALTIAKDFFDRVDTRLPSFWWQWAILLFGLWSVLLALGSLWRPDPENTGLCGGTGFANRRRWIGGFAAVLAIPLVFTVGGSDVHQAALWIATLLQFATLLLTAMSVASDEQLVPLRKDSRLSTPTNPTIGSWPELMQTAGITLDPLPALAPVFDDSEPLIPAEMAAAVTRLAACGPMDPESDLVAMILAAPGLGQEDALALAITSILERFEERIVVVTPDDPDSLTAALTRRLGGSVQVAVVDPNSTWNGANVWVVEASVLSGYLLDTLRTDSNQVHRQDLPLLSQVGMIVWWDIHKYSGVRAANLWAITRRFHRLVSVGGRSGVRTLLFGTPPSEAADRASAFYAHLFPMSIPQERQIRIKPKPARRVESYISRNSASATVEVSVRTGWATRAACADPLAQASLHATLDPNIAQSLTNSPSQADATVLIAAPSQIPTLSDSLMAMGRYCHAELPHYVAVIPPRNPYVDYLLAQYKEHQRLPARRLLVGAEGHPALIARHAQRALLDYPDTRAGLRAIFRWDDETLSNTLRELLEEGNLHREPVRFLDGNQRLQRDFLYFNQRPDRTGQSLDTISSQLREVREVVSGLELPKLEVEPKRAIIDAYPQKVLLYKGLRYSIREWQGNMIPCERVDEDVQTWRGRTSRFDRLSRETTPVAMRGVRRYSVSGTYREELHEVISLVNGSLRRSAFDHPLVTEFQTRALFLETAREADEDVLQLLALVLRCITPVHVAVDESHLEVLPVVSERLPGDGFVSGVAFVDLMPGGIGLTEAFHQDESLIRFLLDQAIAWLLDCRGKGVKAQELFRDVPAAVATGGAAGLRIEGAISLLTEMNRGR
ncbi:MAG: hypothetical protein JNK87_24130 [Bryobacterales bacterium]|nr:hypothetical protein [Bryobacterales bacterium]